MGRPEVYIKHRHGEKVQKHLRVKPGKGDLFLIGSSKEADLRLKGDDINGCHAALRFRSPHWYICDLTESGELRVGDEQVAERKIDGTLEVSIGRHHLTLFSRERTENLFKSGGAEGDRGLHQVIVRSKGKVVDAIVLKAGEAFESSIGGEKRSLPAPTSGEWVITEIGNRVIQQRLVNSQELALTADIEIDRGLKKPLLVSLAVMLLVMTTAIIVSKRPAKTIAEQPLTQKSMDMIFNAKAIQKKRAEVQKLQKAKAGGSNNSIAKSNTKASLPDESQGPKANPKVTQALTSLRQSGLSALVGKIAKRANKQGVMVAASGVSPDKQGSGRALFSTGTTTNGGGGGAAKEGTTFRLGGVGTKGKAGGAGDFKAGTGLAGGSVGTGDVAVVDEETMIDGGLDREVIAEVIKRNIGQIRYCYERQLSSTPDLYGKVQVRFVIGADGGVGDPRIDSSTMKNAMVEGCILRRLSGWKFPLPKGGTMVKVSYPFLFKALD